MAVGRSWAASRSKAASSSTVGGRPIRSKFRRRRIVRASAVPEGCRFFSLSLARMKRSIGWGASPEGRAGLLRGLSDHQSSGSVFLREADSGQIAPSEIQRFSVSTSAALSRSPFGGMRVSRSSVVTNFRSGLSVALPGRMFGAWLSPPCKATSRSSSRKSLFCFFGPWHSMQCFSKIGFTSDSKETAAGNAAVASSRAERMG